MFRLNLLPPDSFTEATPIPPAERAAAASLALRAILMAVGVGTLRSVSAHPIHAV